MDFAFHWDGGGEAWKHLHVVRFELEDKMSGLFECRVLLQCHGADDEVDPYDLIGQLATLRIATLTDPAVRCLHGIIASAEDRGPSTAGSLYEVILMPPIVRAAHRKRSRIFLEKSLKDIIEAVLTGDPKMAADDPSPEPLDDLLADFEVPTENFAWRIQDTSRLEDAEAAPYVVQYEESDLAFVSRLLEREGFSYHFEHTEKAIVLVISDNDGGRHKLDPFDSLSAHVGARYLDRLRLGGRLRPTKVKLLEYNWEKPDLDMGAEAKGDAEDLFVQAWPGAFVKSADLGKPIAQARLERFSSEARYATAEGTCRLLGAGSVFKLEHGTARFEGEYLVTRCHMVGVAHGELVGGGGGRALGALSGLMGMAGSALSSASAFGGAAGSAMGMAGGAMSMGSSFAGSAASSMSGEEPPPEPPVQIKVELLRRGTADGVDESHYRPARNTRRPRIFGTQTAIVTAEPSTKGNEIHVGGPDGNENGCVRLKFHWDTETDRHDKEPTSCWVRVSQIFAGAGGGALYHPRVDTEVIVAFEDGDPDKPIVVGRVYNGKQPAPAEAKGAATVSTMKSMSSPGGGCENSFTFDDKAGEELIHIKAGKNMITEIGNDRKESMKNNSDSTVEADRTETTNGNRSTEVGGNNKEGISGNDTLEVAGKQDISISGNQTNTISGNQSTSVSGSRALTVSGSHDITAASSETHSIGASHTLAVSATQMVSVGASRIDTVAADLAQVVGAAKTVSAGASHTINTPDATVNGSASITHNTPTWTVNASGAATINAADLAGIASGGATIEGATVSVSASGEVTISGAAVKIKGGSVEIEGGTIKISGVTDIAGAVVKVN
ncbi:MAG: type VI secretion system tip protein VgrG [Polyangiaceae bacterium]